MFLRAMYVIGWSLCFAGACVPFYARHFCEIGRTDRRYICCATDTNKDGQTVEQYTCWVSLVAHNPIEKPSTRLMSMRVHCHFRWNKTTSAASRKYGYTNVNPPPPVLLVRDSPCGSTRSLTVPAFPLGNLPGSATPCRPWHPSNQI